MKVIKYTRKYRLLSRFFSSGNNILDNFIKSDAALIPENGITYIALNEAKDEIIGYYNISAGTFDYIDGDIRVKQCGAAHINYFAVTVNYQGLIQYSDDKHIYKLSDMLLLDCINRIDVIRKRLGIGCITLSSTEQGHNLYLRADFEDMDDDFCFTNTDGEHTSIDMYYIF